MLKLRRRRGWRGTALGSLMGLLSTALIGVPALGAERIIFSYPPFGDFSLSTHSLEVFANEGKITSEFKFYAKRASPKQLTQLRRLLQTRLPVTPTLVSQFTYSPLGERVMERLGSLLQTDKRQNGFYSLRAALILAAADPQGLTVVSMLNRFPSRSIRLNLSSGRKIVGNLSKLLKTRKVIVEAVKQEAAAEAVQSQVNFSQQPDLQRPGSLSWRRITLTLNEQRQEQFHSKGVRLRVENRTLLVDLYLPQPGLPQPGNRGASQQLAPVIVISHGAAEDRNTFAYLAKHLASYGFAVAVLEHPGIDSQRFQQYFAGLAGAPDPMESIQQPLDVKYFLDALSLLAKTNPALQGRLNLQEVGVIGHSLGGYTALTLAGAKIDFEQLKRDCERNNFLDISLLVQCKTTQIPVTSYALQDKRVKAAIAINPVTSPILGQSGLSQIQVPLMLVGGSADIITPAVPEQIYPFTWLTTQTKYLALIENATHFSAIAGTDSASPTVFQIPSDLVGPDPTTVRLYLNALSVAFFQTYIAHRAEYLPYLSASYAKFISQAPLNLSLVQSFTAEQLAQIVNNTSSRSATEKSPDLQVRQ